MKRISFALFPALLAVSLPLSGLDVKTFGAVGDGVADDSAAIQKAVSQLKADGGGTLDFPAGTYRIATRNGGPVFDGISNVKINFASGAVLLMDNLEPNGNGGGHGFTFRAPAENIELHNVNVVWKNKPGQRSMGDGIRFEGFPQEDKTIRNILIDGCRVEASAQTGAVLMGCSDITVKNFTIENSWADGLHFNACCNISVEGVKGIRTGDDTLAFVTYYSPEFTGKVGGVFSLPDLGKWNNSNSIASGISAIGGGANGIRIAGAWDLEISNVEVEGKSCGIIVDAGLVGPNHGWQYLASRDIKIKNASLRKCDTGFYVWQFNSSLNTPAFAEFDVECENVSITGCTNDSVHLSGVSGVELEKFVTDGCRWRFRTFRNCSVKNASIYNASFLVIGDDAKLEADPDRVAANRSEFEEITLSDGKIEIQKCRDVEFDDITIHNSPAEAFFLHMTFNSSFADIKLNNVNWQNKPRAFAIQLLQSRSLGWENVNVSAAHPLTAVFEIGGGTEKLRSGNISVKKLNAPNLSPVLMQGGPYAPENCSILTKAGR